MIPSVKIKIYVKLQESSGNFFELLKRADLPTLKNRPYKMYAPVSIRSNTNYVHQLIY